MILERYTLASTHPFFNSTVASIFNLLKPCRDLICIFEDDEEDLQVGSMRVKSTNDWYTVLLTNASEANLACG